MKKLISVFAALALVGSLAAQRGKKPAKAPAKPAVAAPAVPAMPAVAAPSASTVAAAGKGMGLRIGLGAGFATNLMNKGTELAGTAAITNGGYDYAINPTGAGTTTVTGSGKGTSLNGIDANLVLEFDLTSWLFLRSGVGRTTGLKNTYELSTTTGATTNTATLTVTANQLEVPGLLGLNLINTSAGSVYFAAGAAWISGDLTQTLSATTTTAGTTYKDVETKFSTSTLGFMYVLGGRVKVTDSISLFGEVKFLSAAKGGIELDRTKNDGTSTYATGSGVATALTSKLATMSPGVDALTDTKKSATAADFSYTRWNVGVQYNL